ncbi:MAG TPA: ABC transporter ATP-binding protein [Baekduia sp.]|nr:ABC transporter ATP-binding protein [Baekduia sp.]
MFKFLGPYWKGCLASTTLAALAVYATVAIPDLVGRAVDAIESDDTGDLKTAVWLIAGFGVARLVLTVVRRLVGGRVSLGVEFDLRRRLYEKLLELDLAFFDGQQTGQLMSRATVDLQSVRFFLGYGLVFLVQSLLTLFVAAFMMFKLDAGLAAISLTSVPFVVLIAQRYGLRARPAVQETQQRIAELTAVAEESISGVRVIKAFAREERQQARFEHATDRVFSQAMRSTRLDAFYSPFIGFLPQLGLAAILLIGGNQVINGSMTSGEFVAFYSFLLMLLVPMRWLGMTLGMAQRATASAARLFEILDRTPTLQSEPGAPPLPDGNGAISLQGVRFRALKGVDLEIEGGRTVALVGATGSGKTSIVQLLPRLYDPDAGVVKVDGADVRTVDAQSLRSAIAVVDDNPFLFSTSIAENIAYSVGSAETVDQDRIVEAAKRAQAHEFIERLPDGYETRVGERGLTLSGGQRQRLAIARAFFADPRILILDDATSAVDASTEQLIKQALRDVMAGRTTIVIAHRLSTIALADEIVVLEDGVIAAQGTHDELREGNELYREIVEKGLPDQVFMTRNPPEREVAGL